MVIHEIQDDRKAILLFLPPLLYIRRHFARPKSFNTSYKIENLNPSVKSCCVSGRNGSTVSPGYCHCRREHASGNSTANQQPREREGTSEKNRHLPRNVEALMDPVNSRCCRSDGVNPTKSRWIAMTHRLLETTAGEWGRYYKYKQWYTMSLINAPLCIVLGDM